jgi:DNA-binding PadR family transcriptional regulator
VNKEGVIDDLDGLPLCKNLRKLRKAVLGTLDKFENKELPLVELQELSSYEVSVDPKTIKKYIDNFVSTKCIVFSQRDNQTIATLTDRGMYYLTLWRKQEENEKELKKVRFTEALLANKSITNKSIPKLPHIPENNKA